MVSKPFRVAALGAAAVLGIAAAPLHDQHRENGARDMMRSLGAGLSDADLARAIKAAEQFPLGSAKNPVRENQPAGETAYLRRLRCADGKHPAFYRAGNVGEGAFGYIVDLFKVTCAGQPAVDVYIDMYHDGPENRPVPGFTIDS